MGSYKKIYIEKRIRPSAQVPQVTGPKCLICYEEITDQVVYCSKCTFISCRDCFFKLLTQGKGIYICPQCKYTIDKRKNCFKLELDHTTVPSYIGLALFPVLFCLHIPTVSVRSLALCSNPHQNLHRQFFSVLYAAGIFSVHRRHTG